MSDSIPQFEITDRVGDTLTFAGSVTTTPISLPVVAGNAIEDVGIRCTQDQALESRLEYSYDGGTTWLRLSTGESRESHLRGDTITHIKLRAAGALSSCLYEVIINRGPA